MNQRSRAPEARGFTRLSYVLISTRAPSGSRTRTSAMARRQAAATSWARFNRNRIVKEQRAPGRTRTGVAALRVRSPCRWTTSACFVSNPDDYAWSFHVHLLQDLELRDSLELVNTTSSHRGGTKKEPLISATPFSPQLSIYFTVRSFVPAATPSSVMSTL